MAFVLLDDAQTKNIGLGFTGRGLDLSGVQDIHDVLPQSLIVALHDQGFARLQILELPGDFEQTHGGQSASEIKDVLVACIHKKSSELEHVQESVRMCT